LTQGHTWTILMA